MDDRRQTIAALLTPLAPGAIAVIGMRGAGSDAILGRVLRRRGGGRWMPPAEDRPTFCRLVDGGEVLDDVVVVRTGHGGAAAVEINTHGGVRVAQRALMLLERCGATIVDAEVAGAGFVDGDEIEQDADRALLGVSSRRQTRWLLAQRRILPEFLKQRLVLGIDASESCPGPPPAEGSGRARNTGGTPVPHSLDRLFVERSGIAIGLIGGLRVAIVGPPNGGKSTLANRLIGRDRVITSDQIGTTRDWVSETALIRGWPVRLTDTAGVRDTECAIEAEAIRRGRRQAELADLVLVVLDATMPREGQRAALAMIGGSVPMDRPRIVVLNKCDLPIADWGLGIGDSAGGPSLPVPLPISALTGAGLGKLESRMAAALGLDRLDDVLPTAFLPHQIDP